MELVITKPVTVITPSVASNKLKDAIESVRNQTYPCKHLIVLDGPDFYTDVKPDDDLQIVRLLENTGGNGFNGQRIYASFPHLINSDYIAFLDEDNWYAPDHIENLVKTIEKKKLDFAYSLRSIYSPEKEYLCNDDCESLGKWEIFMSRGGPYGKQYLIDTSAYLFTKEFIHKTCHLWHSGAWGEDRRYYHAIKDHAKYDTCGKYTLCYRLDGNPKSVTEQFFKTGNKIQHDYYGGKFPWVKT